MFDAITKSGSCGKSMAGKEIDTTFFFHAVKRRGEDETRNELF